MRFEIRASTLGADGDYIVGLNDNPAGLACSGYRNYDELHRGVFCLCSFRRVGEGLLKGSFDYPVQRSDSDTHSRYRATGGASLHSLDDSIAHTKFMHLSSVPRRRGIEP